MKSQGVEMWQRTDRLIWGGLFFLALLSGLPSVGHAELLRFRSELSANAEVPPNSSRATGSGEFRFETTTNQLTYTVEYDHLSGPATAAHIHGPAQQGDNADVMFAFMIPASPPIEGTASLSPSQAAALLAGELYVNIHTDAHKAGEIRGQIVK